MNCTGEPQLLESVACGSNRAIVRAIALLLRAHDYACALNRDSWEFAVEIQVLRAAGVTRSDLRWLRCKDLLEHAVEITTRDDHRRLYQPSFNLAFTKRSCFILTSTGVRLARTLQGQRESARPESEPKSSNPDEPSSQNGQKVRLVPVWERDRQILHLDGVVVKQFKTPAPNQETILSAFEEEGWPDRIDDPIPPQLSQDAKARLHDAINALNRNQKHRLIHFMGDGSGQGIRWELVKRSVPVLEESPQRTNER
jgi:hypothetical protein